MSTPLRYTLTCGLDPTIRHAGNIDKIHGNEKDLQLGITPSCFDNGYHNYLSKICPSVRTSVL